MSPLLAVAIVLLVVVIALTLWQRKAQARVTESPASPRPTPAPITPVAPGGRRLAAETGAARVGDTVHDPELGTLVYDDIDGWSREDDLDFAGAAVSLTVSVADRPGEAHRAWLRATLADAASLDARARQVVVPELQRRGAAYDDLVAYQMAFGEDDEGARRGYLWYCVGDFDGEIGVSSRDHWRTLTLEVIEP